jgi:ATPase subunit of ABC transporter with duplicated ATPase domains
MLNDEQIAAYKEMAKNASENSMEAQIRANLESTCDKFAGNEDKFDRCMAFLKKVCLEMLGGEDAAEGDENGNYRTLSGDIPDEVCFRICRDYFNDEIWKAEDEENERKKAEEERLAKEKAEKEKNAPAKSAKTKKKAPARPTNPAPEPEPEPEPEKDETEKPVAAVQEEPVTAESLVKKVAERNRLIIEENNKKLGIGLAETIDLFGTGK